MCGVCLRSGNASEAFSFWFGSYVLLSVIGEEAFAGGSFVYAKLPDRAVSIGWYAFANCPNLAYIYIPALITQIDEYDFENDQMLTIIGVPGTVADTYASEHEFGFLPVRGNRIDIE